MCGIFGVFGCDNDIDLERHARLLTHRGPDGFGSWRDPVVPLYLAHCRLAVIDLSERGAQPMCNEDGSVWLTYNGEIYDFLSLRTELEHLGHRFRSVTDSEVIIHAYEEWGAACLERFNGMFAFAIWDRRVRKLFLARDRVGIKPLYYGFINGKFIFASEPKALIGLPFYRKEISKPALVSYLTYGYCAGEESIWNGILQLLPGHILTYDTATSHVINKPFWELGYNPQLWSLVDAVDRFSELMTSSVNNCLASDVPVGVFLSGGYDSSTVAALAVKNTPHVDTFTIGFQEWEKDERSVARFTAKTLGTRHHEDQVRVGNFHIFDRIFDVFDEPLANSAIFPTYMVCAYARRFATVALSGDGGDELFGGYNWYTQTENCRTIKRLAFALEPLFRACGLDRTNFGLRCNRVEHYRRMTSAAFSMAEIHRLVPTISKADLPDSECYVLNRHVCSNRTGYSRWQYLDFKTFLVDHNLVLTDRASMAHSLEVRVPFLDNRLIDFAYSLPDDLRIRDGQKKYLIRRLLETNGLRHLLNLSKQGFSCPVGNFWPTNIMADELRYGNLVQSGILDRTEIEMLLHNAGAAWDVKIWRLALLERWSRKWLELEVDSEKEAPFPKNSVISKIKKTMGVVVKDLPNYVLNISTPRRWIHVRNRQDMFWCHRDKRGIKCDAIWSSDLSAPMVFPVLGTLLMRRALVDWPVEFSPNIQSKRHPDITFILPFRGRERLPQLLLTIKSIMAQKGVAVECLVVEQAAESISPQLPEAVRYIHLPHPADPSGWHKSWAFNQGVRLSKSDIVVCHDADILVPQAYGLEILKLAGEGYQAIHPQRFLFCLEKKDTEVLDRGGRLIGMPTHRIRKNWQGGTLAICKKAYWEIGGFDERFKDWTGEDREFFDRCRALKQFRSGYLPFVHLWHPDQETKYGNERKNNLNFFYNIMRTPKDERIRQIKKVIRP